ncbi:MAG: cation:dicarboxylase symporter family transporter, partial [Tissierellia bacterium]|nr:cation:dicarboxylase symporter family transporter [Tissierellia bacterium]
MNFKNFILRGNLVVQISIGLMLGIVSGIFFPAVSSSLYVLGELFLTALKAAAPILVFFLIISSIANHKSEQKTNIRSVLYLYLLGTFLSAVTAVLASAIFPSTITLRGEQTMDMLPPSGIFDVFRDILFKIVDNPVNALVSTNFIG